MSGAIKLPNETDLLPVIEKFQMMHIKYKEGYKILEKYERDKLMSKIIVKWWKRQLNTEIESYLGTCISFLKSYIE